MIFHPSGSFCDENVRFLPKRKYYCGEVSLPICCCFPPFHICLPLLKYIFYMTCSFVLPCRFSSEWHHLCPRYLGVIFHGSGTMCAQNVRFYLEATIIVHGEVILPICCYSPFSHLFAFCLYIFLLYLSDSTRAVID